MTNTSVFEKKFKAAKEDFVGYKALIKKNESRDFDEEIKNSLSEIKTSKGQSVQNTMGFVKKFKKNILECVHLIYH